MVAGLRSSCVPSRRSSSNAPPSRKDMMRCDSAPVSGQAGGPKAGLGRAATLHVVASQTGSDRT
eukprot:8489662-Heterocapsa_arctica.AAC.1